MPKTELTVKTYPLLLTQLKKVFIEGLQRIEAEKVKTYWRTGELIAKDILKNKDRADYAQHLFERLTEDLGVDVSTLLRAVKFYRAFPIPATWQELSWSHYRLLITVEGQARRKFFQKRAAEKEWSVEELSEAIRLDKLKIEEPQERSAQSPVKLSVTRSRLYTYQILEPNYIHPIEEHLVIDLGFKTLIHAQIKGLRLKAGEIIESEKRGGGYSFKHSAAAPKELYTYKALVEKVIDADTIWLNIDVGFSCWSRQKVRLRGIDAPEIDTKKGPDAKQFVEARLKEVSFIIVKTHKSDKYERYLADIFYLEDQSEPQKVLSGGAFLNQELLDNGLAREMRD